MIGGRYRLELRRGINFGGWLSQCDHTKARYDGFLGKADAERVAGWGFDHVRLPFDYNVVADGWTYLDRAADWCEECGLDLILDLHKAEGYDFNDVGIAERNTLFNNDALKARFVALWEKIAVRYGSRSHVAFELLNEVVEEEVAAPWNALIADAVRAIRKHAKDTPIIYGGIQWNSARTLKLLDAPADANVIYTFHFYEPLIFTHQKAPWVPNMPMDGEIRYPETMAYYIEQSRPLGYKGKDVTDCDATGRGDRLISDMVREARAVADRAGVRLYCGEFGVIDRAPAADTLNWFRDVLSVFGDGGIGCAIWSYKEMDFGLIDAHYDPIRDDLVALYTKGERK